MSKSKTQFRTLYWPMWNSDVAEEKLRDWSNKGWHLVSYKKPNYLKLWQECGFVFEEGAPEDRIYRTDYRPGNKSSTQDYLQLCEDAGWRGVVANGKFYIFSAPADQVKNADFFSDYESKIAKLQRLRLRVFLSSLISIPIIYYMYAWLQLNTGPSMLTAYVLYFSYLAIKLSISIGQLKRQKNTPPDETTKKSLRQNRFNTNAELNIIAFLTFIFMPAAAYILLPDWQWTVRWHFANGVGLLAGYLVLRLFIAVFRKAQTKAHDKY